MRNSSKQERKVKNRSHTFFGIGKTLKKKIKIIFLCYGVIGFGLQYFFYSFFPHSISGMVIILYLIVSQPFPQELSFKENNWVTRKSTMKTRILPDILSPSDNLVTQQMRSFCSFNRGAVQLSSPVTLFATAVWVQLPPMLT